MELKNPILDIETTNEDRDKIQSLKNDFEQLTPEEKFDVIELQNIMLQKVSKHHDMYGIPQAEKKTERDESEIISHMSPKSLDYSQMCVNYYVSKISSSLKK